MFLSDDIDIAQIMNKVEVDSTYAIINFIIDDQGKTQNIDVTTNYDNKPFRNEMQRLISQTDFQWLSGLKDGLKISLPYKIRYDIVQTKNSQNSKSLKLSFRTMEQ
jgi:hypothetical protein